MKKDKGPVDKRIDIHYEERLNENLASLMSISCSDFEDEFCLKVLKGYISWLKLHFKLWFCVLHFINEKIYVRYLEKIKFEYIC